MSSARPVCVFVIENKLGGVAYMNFNIINNTTLSKAFTTRVILLDNKSSDHPRFKDVFRVDELINFEYRSSENKYVILKRLSIAIGNEEGALVCNDALEMETIHIFPTPKTVYQVIHDFYNVKLAVKYGSVVDVYLAHTELFRDALLSADPENINSVYLPHGVNIPAWQPRVAGEQLKIVFTGRLVDGKGVRDIFEIDKLLKNVSVFVQWTIIGRGPLAAFLQEQWKEENNVRFLAPENHEEVMSEMLQHDLFLLPTRFEGSPVTVLEALSCGLVPIVSDLPAGIKEIISDKIGSRVPVGNKQAFADAVLHYNKNRAILSDMQQNCRNLAEEKFDIGKTSDNYFGQFLHYRLLKKNKSIAKIKIGFRLDNPWLPNWLVKLLRNKM